MINHLFADCTAYIILCMTVMPSFAQTCKMSTIIITQSLFFVKGIYKLYDKPALL